MKKMKKLLAILMTMAMVMGLGITGFAAVTPVTDIVSNITVTGLSAGVLTNITGYKFATLQYNDATNEYSWEIATWASEYVKLNADGTAYEIQDKDEDNNNISDLKEAAIANGVRDNSVTRENIEGTSCTFENVLIGGYILIPSDGNADYLPLFAVNTYDRTISPDETTGKPVAIDITVGAKSEDHQIHKSQTDDFAQIGQKVTYTINATFPMLENSEGEKLTQFVITDDPTGLDINVNSVNVTLNKSDITENVDISEEDGDLKIDFAKLLEEEAQVDVRGGEDIVITYEAIVTDTTYNNSVSATSDTTDYDDDKTSGVNGSIQITKVDAEDFEEVLYGAEFQVYDLGEKMQLTTEKPMELIYDETKGAYRPVLPDEIGKGVTTVKTNETDADTEDGIFKIVGLEEGNYYIKETKAPSGYAINTDDFIVTVTRGNATTVERNFLNTKMAALPSTGGMGTTLFTIAGCVIMISAAGLFFATRKKAN